jgi:GGDEF domain-containing protein
MSAPEQKSGKGMRRTVTVIALVAGALGLVIGIVGTQRNESKFALAAGLLAAFAGLLAVRAGAGVSVPHTVGPLDLPAAVSADTPMALQPSEEPVHHEVTGLFNEHYFRATIDTRVLAAKRHLRPVSIALIAVSEGPDRRRTADLVKVASAIKITLRDSDIACHLDDGRFAFILEDTPEDGAVWTLERLRRAIADIDANMVQWAGIACYPAHAFNSGELLSKAEEALKTAWDWPQARIEVASS